MASFAFSFFSGRVDALAFAALLTPPQYEAAPLFHNVRRHFRRHRRHHAVQSERPAAQENSKEDEPKSSPDKAQPPALKTDKPADSKPPGSGNEPPAKADKEQQPPPAKETETDTGAASKPAVPYGPPPPPEKWTDAEVEAGRADCDRRLAGLKILYEKLDPFREGACGLPAPIRLRAFESDKLPSVEIEPPLIVSCKLAAALNRWVNNVVQPHAKTRLDAAVVRLSNASSYVCRSRYHDPSERMSQHAYANALDVGEFITAKGEIITVLDHWNAGDETAAFLHEIHDGACEIFGTTLGPEANEAHKNHFHLDMTERRYHGLCDFTPKQAAERHAANLRAALTGHAPDSAKQAEDGSKAKPGDREKEKAAAKPMPEAEHKSEHKRVRRHRRRY